MFSMLRMVNSEDWLMLSANLVTSAAGVKCGMQKLRTGKKQNNNAEMWRTAEWKMCDA